MCWFIHTAVWVSCQKFHLINYTQHFNCLLLFFLFLWQCCGDEKWGDWRPHLAMVLSNLTHALDLDTRTISTMGDTLGKYVHGSRPKCLMVDGKAAMMHVHDMWLHVCVCVAVSKGLLDAAHFCYLMAQVGFGVFTKKSTKMVLIGSNHRYAQSRGY